MNLAIAASGSGPAIVRTALVLPGRVDTEPAGLWSGAATRSHMTGRSGIFRLTLAAKQSRFARAASASNGVAPPARTSACGRIVSNSAWWRTSPTGTRRTGAPMETAARFGRRPTEEGRGGRRSPPVEPAPHHRHAGGHPDSMPSFIFEK